MATPAKVLPPDLLQDILALQQRLSNAGNGTKGKLVEEFAQLEGSGGAFFSIQKPLIALIEEYLLTHAEDITHD